MDGISDLFIVTRNYAMDVMALPSITPAFFEIKNPDIKRYPDFLFYEMVVLCLSVIRQIFAVEVVDERFDLVNFCLAVVDIYFG